MGLTSQQDIPDKPQARDPWTFRRLFSIAAAVTALAKVFVNPLDILLGYLVIVAGVAELIGRQLSPIFWVFIFLIFLGTLWERDRDFFLKKKPEEKK